MTNKAKAEPKRTKSATLREMLGKPEGASLELICQTTGWQPHSARAAISMLRKAGYEIERKSGDGESGGSIYRITGAPKVTA